MTSFTEKLPESSEIMYSPTLMLENIWYHYSTQRGQNAQEIVNFYQFKSGPREFKIEAKFTISFEFSPLQVKWWHHIFSSMKKVFYMGVFYQIKFNKGSPWISKFKRILIFLWGKYRSSWIIMKFQICTCMKLLIQIK